MNKIARIMILTLLLLTTGASHHWAGEQLPSKL